MRLFYKYSKTSFFLVTGFLMFFTSCKSTKTLAAGELDENLTAKTIIREHYQNSVKFKTMNARVRIGYSDGESSQNVTVSLRMERDKAIWISAPLGIVKAYITPERVSFYNKLQNEYFDGDFSYLSKLLGTEVDFSILQNLLMGQAIIDLRTEKYTAAIDGDSYKLTPKLKGTLYKLLFEIEPKNYRMATQQLSQPEANRLLQIRYANYQVLDKEILPNEINIRAFSEGKENVIDLEYRNIELNATLNFPYSIPKGFKEIEL